MSSTIDVTERASSRPRSRIGASADSVVVILTGVLVSGLAALITYDVTVRFFFNAPLPASVEISQLVQPWVVLLPMALTLARGQHVKVTLVTRLLPTSVRRILSILVAILEAAVCGAIAVASWHTFVASWAADEIMMAAVRLPWWIGKLAMPLGFGLLALVSVRLAWRILRGEQ